MTEPEVGSGIDWSAGSYDEVRARHRWTIPARCNIAHLACDRHAASGRLALIDVDERGDETRYTFAELADLSDRLATVLAALGVRRGDRVAVYCPQRVENPLAHLAAFKLGALSVPLSSLFRADALAFRLGHSGAKVVITDAEHADHLAPVLGTLPRTPHVLVCEGTFWPRVRAAARAVPTDTGADDPAMVVYTSGTTGMPKGALHAHRFIPGRLSGFELIHRLESRPHGDRPFWTPADWAWVGGLVDCVLTPWLFGCPVVGWRRRGFDPAAVLDFIARMRVRSLFLPPTAIRKLRSAFDEPPRVAVDFVHTAGEPLPPDTYAWASRAFGTVYELYGMTEMGATIGNSPWFEVRPGSMGKPFPGHDVRVVRDDGRETTDDEPGEIAVRRGDPGMFLGYLDDPEATAARFRGDFLLTGDLAVRDRDGYLHYRGRADDLINTSGYRVGPTEIEQTLLAHPAIEHAAVVGAPDAERGEIVKAFVVVVPGVTPDAALLADLQRHVKERLAAYEYPRRIVFAAELPMTPSGKLRRNELRAPDADVRYGLRLDT
jgi:acetyl-CoA synthetase